jgi:hypothetical protein
MLSKRDIPQESYVRYRRENEQFLGFCASAGYRPLHLTHGTGVVNTLPEEMHMSALANPIFWNMKIKIAILTLATFAALC